MIDRNLFLTLEPGRNLAAMMSFPQLRQLSKFVPCSGRAAEHHAASRELLLIFCIAHGSPSDGVTSCIPSCVLYKLLVLLNALPPA
jgi:hypothetical protein